MRWVRKHHRPRLYDQQTIYSNSTVQFVFPRCTSSRFRSTSMTVCGPIGHHIHCHGTWWCPTKFIILSINLSWIPVFLEVVSQSIGAWSFQFLDSHWSTTLLNMYKEAIPIPISPMSLVSCHCIWGSLWTCHICPAFWAQKSLSPTSPSAWPWVWPWVLGSQWLEVGRAIASCWGKYMGQQWWTFSGWWFGTFFIFHNIWDNPSHWLIFFKMVRTTNQFFAPFFLETFGSVPVHRRMLQISWEIRCLGLEMGGKDVPNWWRPQFRKH